MAKDFESRVRDRGMGLYKKMGEEEPALFRKEEWIGKLISQAPPPEGGGSRKWILCTDNDIYRYQIRSPPGQRGNFWSCPRNHEGYCF